MATTLSPPASELRKERSTGDPMPVSAPKGLRTKGTTKGAKAENEWQAAVALAELKSCDGSDAGAPSHTSLKSEPCVSSEISSRGATAGLTKARSEVPPSAAASGDTSCRRTLSAVPSSERAKLLRLPPLIRIPKLDSKMPSSSTVSGALPGENVEYSSPPPSAPATVLLSPLLPCNELIHSDSENATSHDTAPSPWIPAASLTASGASPSSSSYGEGHQGGMLSGVSFPAGSGQTSTSYEQPSLLASPGTPCSSGPASSEVPRQHAPFPATDMDTSSRKRLFEQVQVPNCKRAKVPGNVHQPHQLQPLPAHLGGQDQARLGEVVKILQAMEAEKASLRMVACPEVQQLGEHWQALIRSLQQQFRQNGAISPGLVQSPEFTKLTGYLQGLTARLKHQLQQQQQQQRNVPYTQQQQRMVAPLQQPRMGHCQKATPMQQQQAWHQHHFHPHQQQQQPQQQPQQQKFLHVPASQQWQQPAQQHARSGPALTFPQQSQQRQNWHEQQPQQLQHLPAHYQTPCNAVHPVPPQGTMAPPALVPTPLRQQQQQMPHINAPSSQPLLL